MYEVTSSYAAPYSSVCYVRCDWADGTSTRASGVIVGINDVLTALHVVFDADKGGWATRITIVPAADTSPVYTQPFGAFTDVGILAGRAPDWDLDGDGLLTQQESEGDLALIGMKSRIGDVAGWLPVSQLANDFYGVMAGYPAQGTGMMAEMAYADASGTYGVYEMAASLGAGASGGPLLYTVDGVTSVAGVLSSGALDGTRATYAGLFEAGTWDWLASALAANDTLLGGSQPTSVVTATGLIVTGGSGDEALTGGVGWDRFTGNGGNDVIEGNVGVDTAFYAGTRATYTVTVSTSAVTVADNVAGRDGVDSLGGVERVKFSDVSLAFDVSGSAGQAYRLYQAAFNRAPDLPGLGYQMKALDDGWGISQVAQNFIDSPEFAVTYGNLSTEQFVTQLYQNVLHREPDPGGFVYHTGNLDSGGYTRADVLVGFSESPENQAALIGTIQDGMAYTV